jgi:nucleoside 2-deoxyribosyltransferase
MKPKLINKVYLAGPLEGRDVKERFAWRDHASEYLIQFGIESYIPGEDTTLRDADTIVKLDYMMIDNSEALLVNLTGLGEDTPTNSGTLIEIGYAYSKGKLIVGWSDVDWQRENRFLRGNVKPIFFKSFSSPSPYTDVLEYIASFNNRRRNEGKI